MKPFKVAAVLWSRAVLGIPAVVLIARDGEAWTVQTAYHKRTMEPIKVGDVVEVSGLGSAGWLREGYECPRRLSPDADPATVAAAWKEPAPTTKPASAAPSVKTRPYDEIGQIIAYESGDLTPKETVTLFAHLIRTGRAWTLQGCYGRTASALIDSGYIARDGTVLVEEYPT